MMRPLTIVVTAVHYYPDYPSGSTRLAFDEAQFLARQGHTVWLVAPDVTGTRPAPMLEGALHLLLYPLPRFSALDPRRFLAHQQRTQAGLLHHVGPTVDVVHGHSPLQFAGALAAYGGLARTCYSVHSPVRLEMQAASRDAGWSEKLRLLITARLAHRVEHHCLVRAQALTADSHFTRGLLGRLHGQAIRDRTRVIPGWVDLNRFNISADRLADKRRLGWPTDKPVLFTVRRLVPRMGLDVLLRAAKLVRAAGHDFHLVIGGGGPQLKQLQALRRELGLEEGVELIGRVPEADLPRMYAAAEAFVLPTQALECFGLIALEAFASGTPVLATPVGAIPEIVARVEPRWLAAQAGAEALARLLRDYLEGKLPAHAPAKLRQVAAQDFAKDHVLRELTAFALDGDD